MLGDRLRACVGALHDLPGIRVDQPFGEIDAIKLRSFLTLFTAANGSALFEAALDRWGGGADPATTALLEPAR